ncbi:antirestriction protein ArdA [Paraclostridium sordellii]|uniref:antirestriction protein ArdA n=1 Tax=Paraclostridium sordellii TaxID=1505 RepID=UPI001FA7E578|nr:antirestriction protein ArdA [Paeniclostridium sordellii]
MIGDWFVPPIDWEDVKNRIGLNNEYEEYAIHDWQLPFDINEYISIEEINYLCDMVEELLSTDIGEVIYDIQNTFFSSLKELYENKDNIIYYSECYSMEDIAYYLINELSVLGEIPVVIQNYIDYEAYGRNLEFISNFAITNKGVFEYLN